MKKLEPVEEIIRFTNSEGEDYAMGKLDKWNHVVFRATFDAQDKPWLKDGHKYKFYSNEASARAEVARISRGGSCR